MTLTLTAEVGADVRICLGMEAWTKGADVDAEASVDPGFV